LLGFSAGSLHVRRSVFRQSSSVVEQRTHNSNRLFCTFFPLAQIVFLAAEIDLLGFSRFPKIPHFRGKGVEKRCRTRLLHKLLIAKII
jgi:hypothetical protein